MFIGIDLGTSNSSLAVFDGDSVVVVPNSLGENLTPSVVRMDARGADAIKVAPTRSGKVLQRSKNRFERTMVHDPEEGG